jgi:hypothetical protein
MVPFELMRNTLPSMLLNVCAFALFAFSPTATYSFPSGPKVLPHSRQGLVEEIKLSR